MKWNIYWYLYRSCIRLTPGFCGPQRRNILPPSSLQLWRWGQYLPPKRSVLNLKFWNYHFFCLGRFGLFFWRLEISFLGRIGKHKSQLSGSSDNLTKRSEEIFFSLISWETMKKSHQPWRRKQYVPPKCWHLPTSPHGVITQKTNIDIFTAVRTSNLVLIPYRPSRITTVVGTASTTE
jgi:hypothetical protein